MEGRAYGNLGIAHYSMGDFRTAKSYLKRCLKIAKEMSNKLMEGQAYNNLGNAHHSLGDFETAKSHHERCLSIRKYCEKLEP